MAEHTLAPPGLEGPSWGPPVVSMADGSDDFEDSFDRGEELVEVIDSDDQDLAALAKRTRTLPIRRQT